MTWLSAHLFYHDSRTKLLREFVTPLVQSLEDAELIDGYFFIRYWLGGPHIRLRLRTRAENLEVLDQEISHAAKAFFEEHPAEVTVDPNEYARHAHKLTSIENLDDTALSMYPNNSVQFIPYVPEIERYGGDRAIIKVEDHFCDSSKIALDILRQSPEHSFHRNEALKMMLLALASCDPDIALIHKRMRGYQAFWNGVFGDHLEHYLAQFKQKYALQAEVIQKQILVLLESTKEPASQDQTFLQAWYLTVSELRDGLKTRLQNPSQDNIATIILQCVHMHNNRLGVSLYEEAYLAALLRQGLEDLMDEAVLA